MRKLLLAILLACSHEPRVPSLLFTRDSFTSITHNAVSKTIGNRTYHYSYCTRNGKNLVSKYPYFGMDAGTGAAFLDPSRDGKLRREYVLPFYASLTMLAPSCPQRYAPEAWVVLRRR